MKVHTLYTMTIEDYTLFEETGDISFLVNGDFVESEANEQFTKEIEDFNLIISEYFSAKELSKLFKTSVVLQMKYNTINKLNIIKFSLELGGSEDTKAEFQKKFRRPFKSQDDIKRIDQEIEAETVRYKQMVDQKNQEPEAKKSTVSDIIVGCETVLGINVDRNLKVFNLKNYIDRAYEKIKSIEEVNKKHG